MIYIDPTEARANTRLPGIVIAEARELPGLEAMTGADFLITPHDENVLIELKNIPPHRKALQYHVDDGLLIQRKSGSDLLSSIHDLPEIEWRMQEWSPNPWLLVTGLHQGTKGQTVVDGKSRYKWRWSSVSGVLDAWQDRGGSVKSLRGDKDITWWLHAREKKCLDWLITPEMLISKVSRQALRRIEDNWYSTNRAFPVGIGLEMMKKLAIYVVEKWDRPPTFANALALACSDECTKVPLWGPVSQQKVRNWLGVTHSRPPTETGAESGCWLYNLPYRDTPGRTVFVVGGQIIDVMNDQVYQVEVMELGDLDTPMVLPDGAVILNRLEMEKNDNRPRRSRNNRSKRNRKNNSSVDPGTPF